MRWEETEKERHKRILACEQAGKDIERTVLLLEDLVESRHFIEYEKNNYYRLKNYSEVEYFYADTSKDYWSELARLLNEKGFKAKLNCTNNEIYDSMSTYETYEVWVTL